MLDQTTLDKLKTELGLGRVEYFPSLPSSNDTGRQWLEHGCPNYSLVTADEQTRGKGRSGRTWYTLPGSALAFSFILTELRHKPSLITGIAALAVSDALYGLVVPAKVEIKWPNDILVDGRKVCGILVESQWSGEQLQGVIIGVGINVTEDSLAFTEQVRFPAAFLEQYTAGPVSRSVLLANVIARLIAWETDAAPDQIVAAWNQRLAYRGELVSAIRSDSESMEGVLVGISLEGDLILEHPNQPAVHYSANEIQLRPRQKSQE